MENSKTKQYAMDMCQGPILKKMLIFALPLMCSSILQLLFNAADIVVVGRFAGDNSLAAVGSNTALINLLTNVFIGLSVGANVLVGRFYGAKQERDLSETVHTSMLVCLRQTGQRYSVVTHLTLVTELSAKHVTSHSLSVVRSPVLLRTTLSSSHTSMIPHMVAQLRL